MTDHGARCTARWGDSRCELMTRHGGLHRHTIHDPDGRTRRQTWPDRWSAA